MRAMILAAGRGERMRPLTDNLPKPLLRLAGKPVIRWQIERLAIAGVDQIIINHAWLGDQIEAELGDGSQFGLKIRYSAEVSALETLGGVVQALHLLGDEPFILVSGDIYTEFDFRELIEVGEHLARGYPHCCAHLVLTENPAYHPRGDMGLRDGRIVLHAPLLTYANIGVFHPGMFHGLPPGKKLKLFPWAYRFVDAGRLGGQRYDGVWHNLGTPEDMKALDAMLLRPSPSEPAEPA